jgi:thioredoxin-like negative regulator of GroEL
MPNDIIIELNRNQFQQLLQVNPGYIIIKITAEWCKPCKKIQPLVEQWFAGFPKEVQCVELDVDENDDIYAYFRKNKIVAGIPAILAYKKGNLTIGPNYSVLGSNISEINRMFHTCVKEIQMESSGSQTTASKVT